MPLSLSIDELLGYTEGERVKWERWFQKQPESALAAQLQREGRFPTVWSLMDHIFLTEKRHTQRLKQTTSLDERTGIAQPDLRGLFAFGRTARAEFTKFLQSAKEPDMLRMQQFQIRDQTYSFTSRKLAFHMLIHEVRHWAQIATAVRNAGFEPPGFHDLLFSNALE